MFRLTSTFNDQFDFKGKILHLRLEFNNVLKVFEVFGDDLFNTAEKIEIALLIFVFEYEIIKGESLNVKNELVLYIFKEFLGIDLKKNNNSNDEPIMDFQQDAGIIYASFLHAYNMDLFEQHGKLHWLKFIQLFQHLDDKSKIKEVMNYRKMPTPKNEKGNEEYRKHVAEMKRIYALNKTETVNEEKSQEKINKVFDSLASTFKK